MATKKTANKKKSPKAAKTKTTKPKPKPSTPANPAEQKRKLEAVEKLGGEMDIAESCMKVALKEYTDARGSYNALVKRLHGAVNEKLPLFDDQVDAWRDKLVMGLVTEAGITKEALQKLVDGGYDTLGAIANHTANNGKLTALPGITSLNREAFEKVFDEFFKDRMIGDVA